MAGLEQTFRHGRAHAAGSDPADLLCILRHHETLPLKTFVPCVHVCRGFTRFAAIVPVVTHRVIRRRYTFLWWEFKAHYPQPRPAKELEKASAQETKTASHGRSAGHRCRMPSPPLLLIVGLIDRKPASACGLLPAIFFLSSSLAQFGKLSPGPGYFHICSFRHWRKWRPPSCTSPLRESFPVTPSKRLSACSPDSRSLVSLGSQLAS